MVRPNLKRIPVELMQCNQWVLWKAEHRNGPKKPAKVPYDAKTGKYADVTDSKTWSDFGTVQSEYEEGGYSGVGFVLTDNDPYIGIDLDDCFINDRIIPEAKKIVDRLHSYTEKSPSDTGLRIFLKGDLSEKGRRKGNFEVYKSGRFLTLTGRHWPLRRSKSEKNLPSTKKSWIKYIVKFSQMDPENEIDINLDYEPFKLKKSQVSFNGRVHFHSDGKIQKKFLILFNKGDWTKLNYKSQSEADLALCSLLAQIFEGDPTYIDGAFRVSGLMRDKWGPNRLS